MELTTYLSVYLFNININVFLLPLTVTQEMEKDMTKFFWNTSRNSSTSIHWMAWDRMSRHKSAGGLGFKCLRDFNLAMLGKQCWRLLTNPDSLVGRIYKAKYFADTSFMEAKLGGNPSFIWRSIVEAKRFIAAGSVWRIGNGKDVQILDQPWLNNEVDPFVETRSPALINQNVHALFRMDRKEWDLEVIDDIFSERDKQLILQTVIEQELESDVISWKLEASGNYTVKSAYRLIQQQKGAWSGLNNDGLFKMLWNVKAPPKALHLVWRAATSCLPTKMQLQRRHVNVDNLCPVCNEAVESNIHILVSCRVATTC